MDLCMMACWNSRERSIRDFEELFLQTDPGFRLLKVITPASSSLSIIEVLWN